MYPQIENKSHRGSNLSRSIIYGDFFNDIFLPFCGKYFGKKIFHYKCPV
jgi:hypothetical protein